MKLTVGEISKVLGISNENIRYYVRTGLLNPEQNVENNYWEYSSDDVMIISDIIFYRNLGMSINNIKRILDGEDIMNIGDIITSSREEALEKAREYQRIADELESWKIRYDDEINMLGKFQIGTMPLAVRKEEYYDETDNIARYLKGDYVIKKDDWSDVSISFYINAFEEPLKMHRYLSVEKNHRGEGFKEDKTFINEENEHCICTCVKFSNDIHEMIDPLLSYAKENNISLTGEIFGRERTNYYIDRKRGGLYSVYAAIKK